MNLARACEFLYMMAFSTAFTFLAVCVCLSFSHPVHWSYGQDPEVNYGPLKLISSKGYPAEAHTVTTVDGYILEMHRIPGPRKNIESNGTDLPVMFLQHGVLGASTNWLTNLANESFAYLLADAGFDVWMGNVRGNTYSRKHVSLKPDQKEFWDFTFDEHAQKDLPAMLNYVMNHTGQTELFYAGHSQGTIMGFAGFTVDQSLAKHIKAFFAMAPITVISHIEGFLKALADVYDLFYLLEFATDGQFITNSPLVKFLAKYVCTPDHKVIDGVCEDVLFLICGFDPKANNINSTRLPVYYSHTPAGTSVKNMLHFGQEVNSGKFEMYNYRTKEDNMKHYGMPTPPSYNVSELNVPTALFTGGHDWLADPTDVNASIPLINSTGKVFYRRHTYHYEHLDYIWGLDAHIIYEDIIRLAKGFLNV